MMRRYLIWIATLAFPATALMAQLQHNVQFKTRAAPAGGEAGVFVGGANTFEFMAAGPAFGGEVVKNAPYSAEAVTESTQSLADGNKISHTTSTALYRDSQGRTRTEQKLGAIGPWASAGEPPQMIFINDPVANVQYVLNANERTARKFEAPPIETLTAVPSEPGEPGEAVSKDVVAWQSAAPVAGTAAVPAGAGAGPRMIIRGERHELKKADGEVQKDVTIAVPAMAAFTTAIMSDEKPKTESLGTQMIEGVEATGTRSTMTIPAGKIGNERDIEIVSETWYSEQLKTTVLSKHSDPRMGQTTYKLTNVQLVDPLPSLFEVPSGYTIVEPDVKFFRHVREPLEGEPAAK